MKYCIVMRVIDRSPKENYIHTTMSSLKASGLFESELDYELHLFDGGSESLNYLNDYKTWKNLHIHKVPYYTTRNGNWLRALNYACSINCEYVIGLEDDVIFCKNWLESIDKYIQDNYEAVHMNPMTTFYCAYQEIQRRYENNTPFWDESYDHFYGTQCILFEKRKAEQASSHISKAINNIRDYNFLYRGEMTEKRYACMTNQSFDLWLQEWAGHEYPEGKFIASCPSFVQHIGKDGNCKFHQAPFEGEEWTYGKLYRIEK